MICTNWKLEHINFLRFLHRNEIWLSHLTVCCRPRCNLSEAGSVAFFSSSIHGTSRTNFNCTSSPAIKGQKKLQKEQPLGPSTVHAENDRSWQQVWSSSSDTENVWINFDRNSEFIPAAATWKSQEWIIICNEAGQGTWKKSTTQRRKFLNSNTKYMLVFIFDAKRKVFDKIGEKIVTIRSEK